MGKIQNLVCSLHSEVRLLVFACKFQVCNACVKAANEKLDHSYSQLMGKMQEKQNNIHQFSLFLFRSSVLLVQASDSAVHITVISSLYSSALTLLHPFFSFPSSARGLTQLL